MNNIRNRRSYENLERCIFDSVEPYGIPQLKPTHYECGFIPFNYAKCRNIRRNKCWIKNIEEEIVPADNGRLYLTRRFGELTEVTKVFFDNVATGATSLDDYKTTLDNVSNSTEEFGSKIVTIETEKKMHMC